MTAAPTPTDIDPAPTSAGCRPPDSHPVIAAVGVGIPARNEESRIERCLISVHASALRLSLPVVVVVAADSCGDRTARCAQGAIDHMAPGGMITGVVLTGDYGSAGAARAAALDAAVALLSAPIEQCWLASTDADTTVAPDWLESHLRWADQGADGVAGLVDVDWEDAPLRLRGQYLESIVGRGTGYGHRHVHGANLGLRARQWVEVGGCGPAADGEDHELWRRLAEIGARLHGVDDVRVVTSGRLNARAPHGFSRYLAELC